VLVEYDDVAHTLRISADWAGLSADDGGPHTLLHSCARRRDHRRRRHPRHTAGFPAGVSSGSYTSPLIDLDDPASFTAGFMTNFGGGTTSGSTAALLAGIDEGKAYFNVHSDTFPGGEIRASA